MTLRRGIKWFMSILLVVPLYIVFFVQLRFLSHVQSPDRTRPMRHAIVLGAGIQYNGHASDALRDRVETASSLYHAGRVERLHMTGDDGKFYVDEVSVMSKLAESLGVPASQIDIDGHGYRTYESCKRAHEIYKITEAIIVTQRFHLSRALYLCEKFGIRTQGVVADKQHYRRIVFFTIRDWMASFKAWWDVHIQAPQPPVS